MRRSSAIKDELGQIRTIEDLTEVFESIASMHIAKIRNRVVASKLFFAELWQIYSGLRINPRDRLKRHSRTKKGRNVMVAITSEGKFGGGMNDKILETMMSGHHTDTDIVVIGGYGGSWLKRRGVRARRVFAMPQGDTNLNVSAIIQALAEYDRIAVFYQTYDSLRVQKVSRIDLIASVRELGQDVGTEGEVLSSEDYIFEPGIEEIADYMESVMMGVALIQVIMEAKLADYASRFNSMSLAKQRAGELVGEFKRDYYRAKRAESDERLKEVLKVVKSHGRNRTH